MASSIVSPSLNRRHFLGLTLAGAATSVLPHATQAASPRVTTQTDASIEFLTVSTQPHIEAFYDELIAEFEQTHPSIEINRVSVPFEQYTARMATLIATGGGIDVFQLDPTQIPELVHRDLLLSLDPYYDAEETAALVDIAAEVTQHDGVRYSAPLWESSQALFYNLDLFEQAGIEPPTDSSQRWTWQQLLEVASELSNPPDTFGLVVQQWSRPYQIWPLLQSNGSGTVEDVIDLENLTTDGRLNSASSIEAMQFYGDLYNVHDVAPQSPLPEAFEAGVAAMYLAIPTVMPLFKERAPDLRWGATYHPHFEVPVTPCNSWHLGVSQDIADPDAAAEFVRFMTSPEADQRWFEVTNYLPVYEATYETIPDHFAEGTPESTVYQITHEELLTTAVPRPRVPGYSAYEDRFRAAIENIVNGADAAEELDAAVERIDAELARYR